ncbi:MAG: hypothetical protein BGO42_15720 [Flavobacterium sp. 40-81]|nr:MAG: hypothetical protein ABS44_18300 [Chryseobacterium sp. SCN 40-13]OJV71773.1 MAG: hypothetical protein BGO42_15720 [Flavobacterium sp. 40-81]
MNKNTAPIIATITVENIPSKFILIKLAAPMDESFTKYLKFSFITLFFRGLHFFLVKSNDFFQIKNSVTGKVFLNDFRRPAIP